MDVDLLCDLRLLTELDSQKLKLTHYWKLLTPVTPSTQYLTYMASNSACISSGWLMKCQLATLVKIVFWACQYKREIDPVPDINA